MKPRSRHEAVYRALLRILPRSFRERFGPDMLDLFHDRFREAQRAGPAAIAAMWSRTLGDVIGHGLAERAHAARRRRRMPHQRRDAAMAAIWNDVRYAIRLLAKRPGFTATAVLTLALGIGANSAIFSIVHAVLLEPLPYPEPARLVKISGVNVRENGLTAGNISVPDFRDFEREAHLFEALGAHNTVAYSTIGGSSRAERVRRLFVSSGYFRVLRARQALGRLFTADEDRPTPPLVVILSHGLWTRRFGGQPDAIGQSLDVGGTPMTIVGVLDAAFEHPESAATEQPEFYALLDPDENISARSGRYIRAIARLTTGAAIDQAQDELRAIARHLEEQYPKSNTRRSVAVTSLTDSIVGPARRALLILLAAVASVLLIACANLANLLLAESLVRRKELAIRAALGAGHARLVSQLLAESAVLAVAGGAAGLALARWTLQGLVRLGGTALPRADRISISAPVIVFTIALAAVTALVFGLVPAIAAMRFDVNTGLKDGRASVSRATGRGRRALVAAEVALSVMLLVGATLLVKSLWRLTKVDAGFMPDRVLTASVAVPLSRYPEGTQIEFYARLYDRLRRLPGVRRVGAINIVPLSGGYSCDGIQIDERPLPDGQNPCAEARSAGADYFAAMSIPLERGRLFDARDTNDSPRVVVINEAMAERFWPGENPIGKRMTYASRRQGDSREVVGVVGNVRHFGLDLAPEPEFYTPQTQPPSFHTMTLAVRVDGSLDAASLSSAMRGELAALDPGIPLYEVRTVDDLVDRAMSQPRFRTMVLALFAAIAVALALVGVYGVVSRAAAQRTQEIGLRVALGARPGDIVRLVLADALTPVAAGVGIGLAGAFAISRTLAALLFGVTATDLTAFTLAPAALFAAAALATSLPARRAARVDPLIALRTD